MMNDLRDPRLLWTKFALFLVLGLLTAGLALAQFPSLYLAALFTIAIWAFCRAYYFAFYVLEHYVDPTYQYAGLASLLRYALRRRRDS
jgi:hypothetical protein